MKKKNLLVVVITLAVALGISFGLTSLLVKLLSLAFGFTFSWKLVLIVWLVWTLLKKIKNGVDK